MGTGTLQLKEQWKVVFFEMVEYPFTLNSGRKIITTTTRITGKGQSYFMKLLTK